MIRLVFDNVNRNKLHDELVAAGIFPLEVSAINNDSAIGAEIAFIEEVDMTRVNEIVGVHDPTPLPEPVSEKEKIELLEKKINELLQRIENGGSEI